MNAIFTVLYRDEPVEKIVEGEMKSVVPFIGITGVRPNARVGYGLMNKENEEVLLFFSRKEPATSLIRFWRAIKLLLVDKIRHIDLSILESCWQAVNPYSGIQSSASLMLLENQVGGREKLKLENARVQKLVPPSSVLAEAIKTVQDFGIALLTAEVKSLRTITAVKSSSVPVGAHSHVSL